MSFGMTYYFHRSILPSCFVTCQVMFLQPQKFALRNSNPVIFQLSLSRSYTNSTFNSFLNIPSERFKRLDKIFTIVAKLIATGILGLIPLIPVDLIYAWHRNKSNKRLLNKTVEKGTQPKIDVSDNELVFRPLIVDRLKTIFQPHSDYSFYHMVSGEHGTGKTTLARISAREVGHGVIYIDIPADLEKFGEEFGRALNFAFEKQISYTEQLLGINKKESTDPKWVRAMKAFKCASDNYNEKYGKPTVIVYDNISQLARKNPEILDILQDDAKQNADDGKYIAVFISNDELVSRRMQSRSSWSRADKPAMEISDLSEKESKDYLIKKCTIVKIEDCKIVKECKIKNEEVDELYKLVGGRIVDLKCVANKFLTGLSLKVIKQQIFDTIYHNFDKAEMNPKQPNHEAAKIIIQALLNSNNRIHLSMLQKLTNMEPSKLLLEGNVFAYHPENNTITFQSHSIEAYIQENANIFKKNK